MAIMLIATLALASAPSPLCTKLMRSFVQNEYDFAFIHGVNVALMQASSDFARNTGDYSGLDEARRVSSAKDEEYRVRADRVTTLMIGQGCKLPDHVASHETYAAQIVECQKTVMTSYAIKCNEIVDNAMREMNRQVTKENIRKNRHSK